MTLTFSLATPAEAPALATFHSAVAADLTGLHGRAFSEFGRFLNSCEARRSGPGADYGLRNGDAPSEPLQL